MLTLVTACMNRDAHLRRSLPHWLSLPQVGEVIVVDWSNHTPLFDLAALDPRVRVVRAEGEERWILSYAYNLGISRATNDVVFKCDADCLPSSAAFANLPTETAFSAGFWRTGATVGKPSVNGQCLFLKRHFDRVNGYSEYIRTYGRDDEDFYDRLQRAGAERQEIPPAALDFIEHTQDDRIRNQFSVGAAGPEERILRSTAYNEMRNYYLAVVLPWGPDRVRAPFTALSPVGPRCELVQRDRAAELPIPANILEAASLFSLRYYVAKLLKIPQAAADKLDRAACLRVLSPRFAQAA